MYKTKESGGNAQVLAKKCHTSQLSQCTNKKEMKIQVGHGTRGLRTTLFNVQSIYTKFPCNCALSPKVIIPDKFFIP